jgi:hypothetical protein
MNIKTRELVPVKVVLVTAQMASVLVKIIKTVVVVNN